MNILTSTVYFIINCYGYTYNNLLLYCCGSLCNTINVRNISDWRPNELNVNNPTGRITSTST